MAPALGDQEGAPGLLGIERRGVNLHVVHVVERHAVRRGHAAAVAREAREVGRALVEPTDAARGENDVACAQLKAPAARVVRHDANAGATLDEKVVHAHVLVDLHVVKTAHLREQLGGDLLAGDVSVVEDARARVGALAGVVEAALRRAVKVDTQAHQVADHVAARPNHGVHALRAALAVAGAHGVVEPRVVVVGVAHHADAALREHGVAALQVLLADHGHAQATRQVERRVEPGHAAAHDHDVAHERPRLRGHRPIGHLSRPFHNSRACHATHLPASSSMRSSGLTARCGSAGSATSPAMFSRQESSFSGVTMAMLGHTGAGSGK